MQDQNRLNIPKLNAFLLTRLAGKPCTNMEVLDNAIRLTTGAVSVQQIKAYVIVGRGKVGSRRSDGHLEPPTSEELEQNQFDLLGAMSWWCFRLNFRSKSGQNSFKTLAAMSTPSCTPRLEMAFEAVRLSV